jgi:hypothetical protein
VRRCLPGSVASDISTRRAPRIACTVSRASSSARACAAWIAACSTRSRAFSSPSVPISATLASSRSLWWTSSERMETVPA